MKEDPKARKCAALRGKAFPTEGTVRAKCLSWGLLWQGVEYSSNKRAVTAEEWWIWGHRRGRGMRWCRTTKALLITLGERRPYGAEQGCDVTCSGKVAGSSVENISRRKENG